MSGATQGSKAAHKNENADIKSTDQTAQLQKPAAQLEEDDEFEDFPVEDWAKDEEVGAQAHNTHLWEESWDDDDTTDDFSVQLKDELKKMDSARKN